MKMVCGKVWWGLAGILAAGLVAIAVDDLAISTSYRRVNLVSDIAGVAEFVDANLVNPWGIVITPSGRIWVSDNGTGVSTVYNPDGTARPLVVTIPPPSGGTGSAPTGIVGNPTAAFVVTSGTNSAPAVFLWATEDGTIAGWNPTVDPTNAILAVDHSASGAIYKGIARAADSASNQFLFVANFHDGIVEKYDANFNFVTSFTDSSLPAGFAPFNVHNIGGQLYVTFALQDEDKEDDVAGVGNGFVDVFDVDGNLVRQFAAQGTLNSPWGLARAPGNFGKFSGALLVGNFGDGLINAFDANSGAFLGQLTDRHGNLLAIDGLWGLAVFQPATTSERHSARRGRRHSGQGDDDEDDNATVARLYFTAGIAHEDHGLFGFIRPIGVRNNDD